MKPLEAWHVISANLAHLYKMRRTVCYEGYVEADTTAEVIAFKALQEMEEREKNEPLKLADLKQMQGEPVWVRDQGGKGIPFCGIVHNNYIIFASGSVVWLDENAGDVKCGSWWFAYRHKPQEG